jgi:hypothetical protein
MLGFVTVVICECYGCNCCNLRMLGFGCKTAYVAALGFGCNACNDNSVKLKLFVEMVVITVYF